MFYPNLYALESENKDAKLFNCVQVCDSLYSVSNFDVFALIFRFDLSLKCGARFEFGTERAPEFVRDDASVLHAYDSGRNQASLRFRFARSSLRRGSILLLQRLCHRRS